LTSLANWFSCLVLSRIRIFDQGVANTTGSAISSGVTVCETIGDIVVFANSFAGRFGKMIAFLAYSAF
jgi:hypothetical protein